MHKFQSGSGAAAQGQGLTPRCSGPLFRSGGGVTQVTTQVGSLHRFMKIKVSYFMGRGSSRKFKYLGGAYKKSRWQEMREDLVFELWMVKFTLRWQRGVSVKNGDSSPPALAKAHFRNAGQDLRQRQGSIIILSTSVSRQPLGALPSLWSF